MPDDLSAAPLARPETQAADCRPGFSLPRAYYADPDIFGLDMDFLARRWHCAGHASALGRKGDYLTAECGAESAIIVRGDDDRLRAFANVCRHRGSRLCSGQGNASVLVCPYHAWTYELTGRLRRAREMGEEFDAAAHALIALPIAEIDGLIFVSFAADPPDIAPARAALRRMTRAFGWADARIAARRSYAVRANWKLVMENYHECYHCTPAHPEFSRRHLLARPNTREITSEDRESWDAVADGAEPFRVMASAMAAGSETGSPDGMLLAPAMSDDAAAACIFAELGFCSAFLAYRDHGLIYRFIPRDVLATDMEVLWLVRGDAESGRDYDPEKLVWLWDVTSRADKTIIERNQLGVLSRHYRPGPFGRMEPGTRQYVERYVAELAAHRARPPA